MTHLNDNHELNQQLIVKAAKEIMRYLGTIPSMKKAFQDFQYPVNIDLQSKTEVIVSLIKGLSQIDEFHDLVSIKSQKMQQLTKQKTELIAQLKIDEAENLSNNQKLKGMNLQSKELQLSQEGVTRQLTKELDKHKKKMQKLATQQSKSQETIRQVRNKISQIGRAMPFVTSEMYYLGKDRNDSEYFFFMRQPNRIYVKCRSYLMDDNENFYMYEGKEIILQLVKNFNVKGIKQRHLCENIQYLLKDEVITNNILPEDENHLMLQEQKYTDITILDVLNMIKETQQTFTTYLTVKEYQWASIPVRQMFMQQLMKITDLQILKENLRSLQQNFLFAQYVNTYNIDTPIKRDDQSDDDIRIQAKEGRKKVPIRIWGINSEKTKKYWVEYLQECIDVIGIWICAYIFKNNVDKYVKKKMESYYELQMKEKKLRKKQTYQRGRPPIKKQESEKYQKSENIEVSQNSEVIQSRRPNLRARKQKKMNIDSEIENEPEEQEGNEQSSNQDCCEICGQYGKMICCDTCPKVYHVECLKMKDIPEGQWSCVKCLQKLSNERQTRSRVKKIGKFM